jgi:MFS family permease
MRWYVRFVALTAYSQVAFLTTVVFIGWSLGAPFWGWFADKYGRRWAVIISFFVIGVAGAVSAFSVNYIMLLIFRGLVGFGIGGISFR